MMLLIMIDRFLLMTQQNANKFISEKSGRRLVHVTLSNCYVFSLIVTLLELIKMFSWKSITKIQIPTFEKSSEKLGVGILVIDFQWKILMSSGKFQNKFHFNLWPHSTLYVINWEAENNVYIYWFRLRPCIFNASSRNNIFLLLILGEIITTQ